MQYLLIKQFVRVSTQKQYKRGDLENQINTLLSYSATKNPINIKVYKDVGSGLNDCRKDMIRLIQDIEEKQNKQTIYTL